MTRPALALIAFALAACSGGGGPTAPATGDNSSNNSNASASATVSLISTVMGDGYGYETTANSFTPGYVTIAKGGSVTFSNNSGVLHNVTFTATSGAPENVANFASGDNTRVFNTAGTFSYHCTNHENMNGTVVVK